MTMTLSNAIKVNFAKIVSNEGISGFISHYLQTKITETVLLFRKNNINLTTADSFSLYSLISLPTQLITSIFHWYCTYVTKRNETKKDVKQQSINHLCVYVIFVFM